MRGLRTFLATGRADEALRLGWTKDELFRVPPLWARVDLCGAALLIGDREVVGITPTEIRIKTSSGATLAFYRKPAVDYRLVYETRVKLFTPDMGPDEAKLRAREWTVRFYREHTGADLESAKRAVTAAIERRAANETTTP